MAAVPKRVADRLVAELGKYQKIIESAKVRDVNEADTVTIVKDVLAYVFGYDKYHEITSEFCVRSTYCDLAIKVDKKVKFLIEVKAIGLDLKENHLRQALDYGANHGIEWIILTNGLRWTIHCVRFEKPISSDLVCEFDILELNARKAADAEILFLLCKEGLAKAAIEEFHQYQMIVNQYTIGALLLTEPLVDLLRKQVKRLAPEVRADSDEIVRLLQGHVLKREVLEGEGSKTAQALFRRAAMRDARKNKDSSGQPTPAASKDIEAASDSSGSERTVNERIG